MNINRKKSLEAILCKKSFTTNCLWGITNCCAIGYALEANDINAGNYRIIEFESGFTPRVFWSYTTGLTMTEIKIILELNDSKKIKELHEYCENLLNSEV